MVNKEELKKKYKQTHTQMGIFQIRNKINGKIFINGGTNLPGKINKYKFTLQLNSCYEQNLQKEWNEYGEENFSFEILDILEPKEDITADYKEDIKTLEAMWMDKLQPYGDKGYNKITVKK